MHLTRQIAMTILPSITNYIIARKCLVHLLNQDQPLPDGPGGNPNSSLVAAASQRKGLKSLATDILSLASRLVQGVDKQAKNVPADRQGFFSQIPQKFCLAHCRAAPPSCGA